MMRSIFLAMMVVVGSADADVLFNNFGPGDSYYIDGGWTVSDGVPTENDWDQGHSFTVAGGDFVLDTIELAVSWLDGQNQLFVWVYVDEGGIPGTLLETVVVNNQMGPFHYLNPPIVAALSTPIVISEGETYWVIGSAPPNTWTAWNYNDIDDVGDLVLRVNLGPWQINESYVRGAFRVNAIPLPPINVDCNSNGVDDAFELENGFAEDCNSNDIPDDCDLAGNDVNNNSIPDECECISDINDSGEVNVIDLLRLLLCFGLPAAPECLAEDINGDGAVNVLDLIELLLAFGQTCP